MITMKLTVNSLYHLGFLKPEKKMQLHHSLEMVSVCLLDVMEVNLVNMDLFLGEWFSTVKLEDEKAMIYKKDSLDLGSYFISKHGYSLLQKKCELKLIVERNISSHIHKTGLTDFQL